jgi:hypothetical protein
MAHESGVKGAKPPCFTGRQVKRSVGLKSPYSDAAVPAKKAK